MNPSIILAGKNPLDIQAGIERNSVLSGKGAYQERKNALADIKIEAARNEVQVAEELSLVRMVTSADDPDLAYPQIREMARQRGHNVDWLPEQYDPNLFAALEGALTVEAGQELTEFERIIGSFSQEDQTRAKRIRTKLEPGAAEFDPLLDEKRAKMQAETDRLRSDRGRDPIAALRARADAAGLAPGTPEYQKFMIDNGRGAGLQIRSDGKGGFELGTNGLPDVPTAIKTEALRGKAAFDSIMKGLDDWDVLVADIGATVLPGAGKDALLTARRSLQLQMKELFNLGVLNGPDLMLMDELLVDPTDLLNAGMDGAGVADVRERAKANSKQLRDMMRDLIEPKLRTIGREIDAPDFGSMTDEEFLKLYQENVGDPQ
ncbi:MAG: hypothetical protein AAGI03_02725 [Pseudomonadota bacterium]